MRMLCISNGRPPGRRQALSRRPPRRPLYEYPSFYRRTTAITTRGSSVMPRSSFRRRGARMREYAAGAASTTDGSGDGAAPAPLPPPPGLGMPFSRRGRRGRRGRQAPGETGSVIPKLLMKMVVYGVVMVAMKYAKKQGKDDAPDNLTGASTSPGGIVSRITFLLNDVLGGKSGDRVLLPGTKTLRVGADEGADNRAANVYVVPNFLEDDVASRWRASVAYELERSGSIPSSHPLSAEVSKTLASSNINRKLRALGMDGMYVASTVGTIWDAMRHDEENDGWTVVVPLSDDSSNHDTSLPKIRFACGPSHTDKQVGQEWCESVELELNTAIVLDKSAKFDIESSSNRHHFGVVGSYRAKKKEEL